MEETNQIHQIKLWEGIFKPTKHFTSMGEGEQVKGLALRIILLSLIMGIVSAAVAYFTFSLELKPGSIPDLSTIDPTMLKTIKTMGMISGGLGGAIGTPITMLISAAILLIFFRDIPFTKLFAIQIYTTTISTIGAIIQIPLMIATKTLTPFLSLGILGETLKVGAGLQTFLSSITVFLIWQLYVLITALKLNTSKSKNYTIWMVIILYTVYLILSAAGTSLYQSLVSGMK